MDNARDHYDVIVVGGGIAGLAAAHKLSSRGLQVITLEKAAEPGGHAATVIINDQPVDVGAAFISAFYDETLQLINDIGLSDQLTQRSQTAYIARDDSVHPLWPLNELLSSNALSRPAKFRLLGLLPPLIANWRRLDIADLPRSNAIDRETANQFSARYLGQEASQFFFDPLLRGLFFWDSRTTSSTVVMSILKAFGRSKGTYRLAGGMRALAQGIAAKTNVVCGATVESVERTSNGEFRVHIIESGKRRELVSSHVVCAVPAPIAKAIVKGLPDSASAFLNSVTYSQTSIVTFSVPALAKDYPMGAVLFPPSIVDDISSVNPVYQFVDGREQSNKSRLLCVYLSDSGAQQTANLNEQELGGHVLGRVKQLLRTPDWINSATLMNVQRWPMAIPRFNVGHMAAVTKFADAVRDINGLAFAGDYLAGPYLDGAVRSGLWAAKRIMQTGWYPKGEVTRA